MGLLGRYFVYPWSSYSIIFDYKVPCNASRVDNITATFDRYLTVRELARHVVMSSLSSTPLPTP